jgi:ribosomal protein L3 glutamine methyltransferase
MSSTTLMNFLIQTEASFLGAQLYFGHGTNNAWDEAVALAISVLNLPPHVDKSEGDRLLTPQEQEKLEALVLRRVQERMPLPYLTNEAWFAGLKYYVDERVIIPRSPVAELIEHHFSPWLTSTQPVRRILDLCTGSGCIAIACAHAFPEAQIDAIDLSLDALAVARKNVESHHCPDQVKLLHSDLFEACSGQQYDIIISNPPYVNTVEMKNLPPEYHWEPVLALEAGTDGLRVVHRILAGAVQHLTDRGLLIMEVGSSEEAIQKAYPNTPFIWLDFERGGEGVLLLNAEDKSCWAIS